MNRLFTSVINPFLPVVNSIGPGNSGAYTFVMFNQKTKLFDIAPDSLSPLFLNINFQVQMNPANLLAQQSINPYSDAGLNKVYGLLFCDNVDMYKSETQSMDYPWDTLLSDNPDPGKLSVITIDDTLETRQHILAYNLLAAKGFPENSKDLLGVVIEVGLGDGLDVLAAYSDGTCRYINHSERLLVWDTQTDQSTQLVDQLFSDSITVINRIGPWDKARTSFPAEGMIKLTFLVSDGLYFGEGPIGALQNDPMAGPVIDSAIQLMSYLIDQTL